MSDIKSFPKLSTVIGINFQITDQYRDLSKATIGVNGWQEVCGTETWRWWGKDTLKTHLTMLALFCHSVALLRSLAVHLRVWLESGCHGHLVAMVQWVYGQIRELLVVLMRQCFLKNTSFHFFFFFFLTPGKCFKSVSTLLNLCDNIVYVSLIK